MSIYSGFATRKDQTNYNQLLMKLLHIMEQLCIAHMQLQPNPSIKANIAKIISRMIQYQQHKYLPPKFAHGLAGLAREVGAVKNHNKESTKRPQPVQEKINDKIGSTAYSQPQIATISKQKLQVMTHRRLKTQQQHPHSIKARPSTSTSNRKTATELLCLPSSHSKFNPDYRQSFYKMHERKLQRMNKRYLHAQRLHSLHIEREESCIVQRPSMVTPKKEGGSFKSSKFDFQSERVEGGGWEESSNEGLQFGRRREMSEKWQ